MKKIAIAVGLFGLIVAASPPSASAAPMTPLSKSAISGPSDVSDAGWRRCWRDRWGRMHCRWCWRDRWGRVICR